MIDGINSPSQGSNELEDDIKRLGLDFKIGEIVFPRDANSFEILNELLEVSKRQAEEIFQAATENQEKLVNEERFGGSNQLIKEKYRYLISNYLISVLQESGEVDIEKAYSALKQQINPESPDEFIHQFSGEVRTLMLILKRAESENDAG